MEKLRHVISARQFDDPEYLNGLFDVANQMERDDVFRALTDPLRGRILATLFYEPSTRTRFSFEAAMQKLGGGVLTAENMRESSSATKGETIEDTIRIVSGYADAIAIRHYEQGTAEAAARISPVPVINAGDGVGEHPTQALTDVYTIRKELGRLSGLRVVLVGDLLNGRTIHSLLPLLALYKDVQVDLVSPWQLRLPLKHREYLLEKHVAFHESEKLDGLIEQADVLYITRVQKERFATVEEYDAVKDSYILDARMADRLKPEAIIMHALPRVNEISPEVDANARAAYFRQAKNGLYIRMALLKTLLA
ncbi:aspartate carbamoyltransferase [Granulicella sp. 5B5]|uniref:aspartate carbamoyltransferase n=1 Tax=Granulicella sp. 5B5 TaxID=1617967 RepID=UPI0015F574B7|nr:aspartate carbamoyltransferase [Granulicella sp. 5B5]QMV19485.1 aspartate carbamoyltransferase [Granulicella sp. 5B5]